MPSIFTDSQGDEEVRDIWRLCCPSSTLKKESAKICCWEMHLVVLNIWTYMWRCHDISGVSVPMFDHSCSRKFLVGSAGHWMFPQRNIFSFFLISSSFIWPTLSYWKRQRAAISYCTLLTLIFQTLPHHIPKVNSFPGWLHLHYSTVPLEHIFHTVVIIIFSFVLSHFCHILFTPPSHGQITNIYSGTFCST